MSREGQIILQREGEDKLAISVDTRDQLIIKVSGVTNPFSMGFGGGNIDNNVAIGVNPLKANLTGQYNVAIGHKAMKDATAANSSTAIGYQALERTTTGGSNVAIGRSALQENTEGKSNTAMGYQALHENLSGDRNIAIGAQSLFALTQSQNIGIGWESFRRLNTGTKNIAIGSNTGNSLDGGDNLSDADNSIFIGASCKGLNNSDDNVIVIGSSAVSKGSNSAVWGNTSILRHHFSGAILVEEDVLLGVEKLRVGGAAVIDDIYLGAGLNSVATNIALGLDSLGANVSGTMNTGIGHLTLRDITTGPGNVAVGYHAGVYQEDGITLLTTPQNCVFIGVGARGKDNTDNNAITIGKDAISAGANTVVIGNDNITDTYLKGIVHFTGTIPIAFSFTSATAPAGVHYVVGGYSWTTSDVTLNQASLSQSHGSANNPYNSHVGIVASGAGTVDTGQVGIEVFGDTFDEETGILTVGDVESLTDDITSLSLNGYLETAKKFVGTVSIRLYVVSGAPTTFSATFNYGFSRYGDLLNHPFIFNDITLDGRAGANDSSFDIAVKHHSPVGWTYAATGFIAGNGNIIAMKTDLPSMALVSGQPFSWKRTNIAFPVDGSGKEGIILEVTTGSQNSVDTLSGVAFIKADLT